MSGLKNIFRGVCLLGALCLAGSTWAQMSIEGGSFIELAASTNWGITTIGATSASNELYVANQAVLVSADAYVGRGAVTSNDNNLVDLSQGASWVVDHLYIGQTNNEYNVVSVYSSLSGGASPEDGRSILEVNSVDVLGGTNGNELFIGSGGMLYSKGAAFDASMDGFSFGDGAALKLNGSLTGLDGLANGQVLILSGSSAEMVSTNNFTSTSSSIFLESNALFQAASITNAGSTFRISGSDVVSGGDFSVHSGGLVTVLGSNSQVGVGGEFGVRGDSGVEVDSASHVGVDRYYQDSGSRLSLSVYNGVTPNPIIVTNAAAFEADAIVQLNYFKDHIGFGVTNSVLFLQSSELVIDGVTNATDATALSAVLYGNAHLDGLRAASDNLYFDLVRQYMSESAGFELGSMVGNVLDDIDAMARGGDVIAQGMSSNLFTLSAAQQKQQVSELYAGGIPTYAHGQSMYDGVGRVISRASAFHMMRDERERSKKQPRGANGPHSTAQSLQGWAMGYGNFGSADAATDVAATGLQGYDVQTYGTVMGIDYEVDDFLFGLAGGFAGSSLETDGGDQSDGSSSYGVFYISHGVEEWFVDLVASYGQISVENESRAAFKTTGETDATQYSFFLGVGKEWRMQEENAFRYGWRFRPEAGIRVGRYDQDAYTETSVSAIGKEVEGYARNTVQSRVGAGLVLPKSYKKFGIESELRAYWLHEFETDEQAVGYTLVGGSNPYQFTIQGPSADTFEIGGSVKGVWSNGLQIRLSIDGQFGDAQQAALVSGSVLYGF